jgi:tetratricopeptide (TPR) repeat protein
MRTSRRHPSSAAAGLLLLLAAGLIAPPPAAAQADPAAERSRQSRSGPRELGEIDFPASARSAEALAHFQRGVAALHSFWYDEAADAFRAAWEAEPGFALAAWGEAMTCNHPIWKEVDLECGRAALARLGATPEERAAAAPTARERAWLAAVETLYAEEGDKRSRDLAYERATADFAAARAGGSGADEPPVGAERSGAATPSDAAIRSDAVEAAAFHTLALQGLVYGGHLADGERFPTLMRSAAALERLFDRAPRHPGVLHYLIHAYDDPVHAPLGLRAAELYAEVAPAAHHALHMPSHIFVQLGRWDDAVASNEDAWAASVAWQTDRGHGVERRDYHSLSWLLYAELQQGRWAAAARTIEVARRSRAESDGHARVASAVERMEARYEIETGEAPPAAAAEPATGAGEHTAHHDAAHADPAHAGHGGAGGEAPADPAHAGHGGAGGDALFARGLAAARSGDPTAAEALAARLAEDGGTEALVMALELEGLALLAREKPDEAVARLTEAAELEATMPPPSGPPEPPKPAHELLGEVLLDLGRPAEAADAFAAALRRTPRRAASLLGAARAARQLGDERTARRHYRELTAIWSAADDGHPGLAEARSFLDPARAGD